jgi:glycosyltransferase involved in cell wall biosynthesis
MTSIIVRHVVVHQFDPAEEIAGGIHGFIGDLIRFAPEGHDFRVVGVDGTGRWRRWAWQEAEIGGRAVSFLPLATLSAGRQKRVVPHTLRLIAGLLARHPATRGALIHAHRAETGAAVTLAYPGAPLIQFVHTDSEEGLRHRTETFWRFLPETHLRLERFAVRRAARTWVFNAVAARRLEAASPTVAAGTNWFDDGLFHPEESPAPRPLTIGWIGRFEPPKDPVKAVEVLGEIHRAGTEFSAWFAGSGTLEEPMRRRVRDEGIESRVAFHGTLSPAAVAAELRRTDVLLVSSLWEGQPRAVLEALGSGVPVVSTAVGDVPQIVQDGSNGFVARDGSIGELAHLVAEAAGLRDRARISGSVRGHRASVVVRGYFSELERLAVNGRGT